MKKKYRLIAVNNGVYSWLANIGFEDKWITHIKIWKSKPKPQVIYDTKLPEAKIITPKDIRAIIKSLPLSTTTSIK